MKLQVISFQFPRRLFLKKPNPFFGIMLSFTSQNYLTSSFIFLDDFSHRRYRKKFACNGKRTQVWCLERVPQAAELWFRTTFFRLSDQSLIGCQDNFENKQTNCFSSKHFQAKLFPLKFNRWRFNWCFFVPSSPFITFSRKREEQCFLSFFTWPRPWLGLFKGHFLS